MAVNYTDVQKIEKYISRTNFDALEMAAVPEGTEFNIVDPIHESDLDSDVLQKLNNNAKINTANTFTNYNTFKYPVYIQSTLEANSVEMLKYISNTGSSEALYLPTGRTGTLAITADIPTIIPNPADSGTVELTKLQVGATVYNLPCGGGSGDVTAAGNNTFTGNNTFSADTRFKDSISIYDVMNPDTLTATLTTKIDNTGATRLPLMEVSYEFQPSHNGKYPLFDFYQYGGGAENSIGVTNFKDGNMAGGDDMFKSVVISSRGQIRYVEYDTHNENNEKLMTSYNLPHRDASGIYTLATTDDISNATYFNNEIFFMSPVQFTQGIKDSASGSIITLPDKGGTFALVEDTKRYHHHIVIKSTTGTITDSSGIYLNADLYSKSNEEMTVSALITYF